MENRCYLKYGLAAPFQSHVIYQNPSFKIWESNQGKKRYFQVLIALSCVSFYVRVEILSREVFHKVDKL